MKPDRPPSPALFEVAADTVRQNIESGRLEPGTVLLESALAELMQSSRAPIKRALAMLEQEALISRFDGRGYVVGSAGQSTMPSRIDLRTLDLEIAETGGDYLGQPNWMRLHDDIEAELSRCRVFGDFRVIENQLADYCQTSRTVVRDILGRLQERGIVAKSATSRWIVRPLTAQTIKDKFRMRSILEVAALRDAGKRMNKLALASLAREIDAVTTATGVLTSEKWFAIVNRFIGLAILSTPNSDLATYIASNSKALQAVQKALFTLGLPRDLVTLKEIGMIVDLLLVDSVPGAANMLESHLEKSCVRTIAQLKIVAIMPKPTDLPPYVLAD
jgi:DNA-binding GntR family transcriptional regulator